MQNAFATAAAAIGLNEGDQQAALNEYLTNGGQRLDPATTAWCAAFVDATLRQSGGQGTGKLNARSYMDWGQGVDTPQQGDVAVFSRGDPNGWQGHVGFYDGTNPDGTIRVLGGNQGDSVKISSYDAGSLLGYRRANGAPQGQTQGQQGQPQVQPANQFAQMQPPEQKPYQASYAGLDPRAFQTQPQNRLASVGFDQATNPFLAYTRGA